jgi:NAD(P) transhydrogenase subunit alpha
MRLAVLKERHPGEARVAATADTVKKIIGLGLTVAVETGAGLTAAIADAEFEAAGAEIAPDADAALKGAGILFAVQAPGKDISAKIAPGTLLVCTMNTFGNPDLVQALAEQKITGIAMEMVPRITRAQSMDVLSSQANLAGYRAVIEAADAFARGFPMMMTAAGTVPPARVLVIGAGVAGLQAIATARRLGGIVSGTDVRPAAKEEIKSLGAIYVGVEDEETAKQTGPYASVMSDAFRQKQADLMAATVAKNDIIVCTALVQGRKAPVIVTAEMVASMKAGSVIIDLAADSGGNCAATVPGETITTDNGVIIIGHRNWPSRIAVAASALYARNLLTFLTTFWDKEAQAPNLKETDDIIKGVLLTKDGKIVHPAFQPAAAA